MVCRSSYGFKQIAGPVLEGCSRTSGELAAEFECDWRFVSGERLGTLASAINRVAQIKAVIRFGEVGAVGRRLWRIAVERIQ